MSAVEKPQENERPNAAQKAALRKGWSTGACAAAAAGAAWAALARGSFPDPAPAFLPEGRVPLFPLAYQGRGVDWARAGVIKDAGDDPDVTHGALIWAEVRRGAPGAGLQWRAGEGVGMVTLPGLPLPPGEPAINPGPRCYIRATLEQAAPLADLEVEIGVQDGRSLAEQTWNPKLGIVGGLSILGTNGVVVPYSCAAWIDSIRSGVRVARALGLTHLVGAVGKASGAGTLALHGLPEQALIDMGDFVGAFLKALRFDPPPRATIGGGIAKLVKLAQGAPDLHSGRSQVDFARLAEWAPPQHRAAVAAANTVLHALTLAGPSLAQAVADAALLQARRMLQEPRTQLDVAVFDRAGGVLATAGP